MAHRLLLAGLAAVLLQACQLLAPGPPTVVPTPLPHFVTTLDTPDGTVGIVMDETSIHLVFVDGGGGTSSKPEGDPPHVYLLSAGGETGAVYNTYVYGIAPAGAATFEIAGSADALGGKVVDGTFVLALKAKDVQPADVHWTFRAADGSVLASGANITR